MKATCDHTTRCLALSKQSPQCDCDCAEPSSKHSSHLVVKASLWQRLKSDAILQTFVQMLTNVFLSCKSDLILVLPVEYANKQMQNNLCVSSLLQ